MVETTRQARACSSVASRPATTGISADERAPAATSWNIRSGIRNAAKKASSSAAAPNVLPMTTSADPAEDARDEERARDDRGRPGRGRVDAVTGRRSRPADRDAPAGARPGRPPGGGAGETWV